MTDPNVPLDGLSEEAALAELDNDRLETELTATQADLAMTTAALPGTWNPAVRVILTQEQVSAKEIALSLAPLRPAEVALAIIGGPPQVFGEDYTVSGNILSWDGLGLDGALEAGDELLLSYFS